MGELGDGLVASAPSGPCQDLRGRLLHRKYQFPQQPTNLGHAQPDQSPRRALNCARLLAHAFLTVMRAQVVGRGDQKGGACTLMLP